MSKRRMFSQSIVENDVFLDMPLSSQALYLHLSMNADDYGFVSPKRIMRMIGANDDDLKILILKRYILTFDSGAIVIKHWHINNTIRKDRSQKTTYAKELETLTNNEYGAYTEIDKITTTVIQLTDTDRQLTTSGKPNDNQMATQIRLEEIRLDKIRLDESRVSKDTKGTTSEKEIVKSRDIDTLFVAWKESVGYELKSNTRTNRDYASKIIRQYGLADAIRMVRGAGLASEDRYAPRISNFSDLYRKWDQLMLWGVKKGKNHARAEF